MNKLMVEFRQNIANSFIETLLEVKDKNIPLWQTPWFTGNRPRNGNTNRPYKGINALHLRFVANNRGIKDPRWFTLKQIKSKGWRLKDDYMSETVEYWFPRVTYSEETDSDGNVVKNKTEDYSRLYPKYFRVYNGEDIEGIEPWNSQKNEDVNPDEAIFKISNSLNVDIIEDQVDKAYYIPTDDKIHLPERKYFKNSDAYNSTALHELIHSTGHEKRLNRPIKNGFGSQEYAKEELVAEIGSCFASELLHTSLPANEFNNSKAYLDNWISIIQDKPNILTQAINAADKAADYIIDSIK